MNELNKLLDLLHYAVEQGQTITLTADEVSITVGPSTDGNVGQTRVEITLTSPSLSTGS